MTYVFFNVDVTCGQVIQLSISLFLKILNQFIIKDFRFIKGTWKVGVA